jgi:nickel transport protein
MAEYCLTTTGNPRASARGYKPRYLLLVLFVFSFLMLAQAIAPTSANAHQMNIYATVEGRTIRGEVYFRGKVPAQDASVRVLDSSEKEIGKTTTDEQGKFTFHANSRQDLHLVAESGDGHGADPYPLSAEMFSTEDAPLADSEQIQSLRAQIEQLHEQIAQYQSRARVRDILGGVGWIVGITGMAYYYLGIKRKRQQAKQECLHP